ncbi:hypothetical protein BDB00DRAFT_785212 [Zychaea mexicana]|uniref:uncharacterized protein n=1 Tax=Zychaea mexicana TaxID=64656 RepID=UPI0022FE0105|nr:uncharacterized protein BDB00DRAFT_785212 [Zychaea mexicana]KAI9496753.1 hypothetical protein BDB00DRAFT_785212 [Zychaea mexicana]
MSVLTAYPPVTLTPSISSPSAPGTKRKRSASLHVRFCSEAPQVEYTYSQSDYDRSGLFPTVTPQDIENIYNSPVILAVSFNMITTNTTTTTTTTTKALSQKQTTPMPPLKRTKQQKPPRLSIDTSNIHGPLFFTSMTTNHQKKSLMIPPMTPIDHQEDNDDDLLRKKHISNE